ncbi:MAG: cytochrome P450 [Kordiimonadaceae bacterium]|nr:cytochrome P450 [Kordiimonadaceae bacterium]
MTDNSTAPLSKVAPSTVHKPARLRDIPGNSGLPILGHTLKVIKNPVALGKKMLAKYGPVYRTNAFFRDSVHLYGVEANEFLLLDKDKNFSSEMGWWPYLGRLFPRGLMLLDFDEHKAHRRIMATAFKTTPMKGYLERLNDAMPERIKAWGEKGSFEFYPAIKTLSLDMATTVFLGLEPGEESEKVNKALTNMVAASVGIIRIPLPGTRMGKGVKSRKYLVQYLDTQIAERRVKTGSDIFTQLCQAEAEDGTKFTNQEIIDHMIFLWMAAHDTITSSVTSLVYQLARNTDWQQKLRTEITELGLNDGRLPYKLLNKLELTEFAFKEALRLNPPVPMMPRKTVREVAFGGYILPKNTIVNISPISIHRSEDIWDNPQDFNPLRFSAEGGAKERHRFAWIPFGGGAHMCVGLHFAYMQTKVIMTHLLPHFEITVPEGYKAKFQILPLIKPIDGLPITLKAL